MKRKGHQRKKGFTLIEVALVIAITGAVFAAIASGTGRIIARTRYNDVINDFSSFLQGVYSSVINVQNIRDDVVGSHKYCTTADILNGRTASSLTTLTGESHPGRSNCVFYGKLITFNETADDIPEGSVYVYDVIGNDNAPLGSDTTSTIDALKSVRADVVAMTGSYSPCDGLSYVTAGNYEFYNPRWDISIEKPTADEETGDYDLFTGAVLIVRSPVTGTIHTFAYTEADKTFEVQNYLSLTPTCSEASITDQQNNYVYGALQSSSNFSSTTDTILCIAAPDKPYGDMRRALRISADGKNTSAVEILPMDIGDNPCNR